MSLSKYSKRRGQFEALEAKQLFAADLVGGAAADLPDTVVVAGNISEDDFVINPLNVRTNLGGQEGEPLMNTNLGDHLVVDGEGLYQRNELELAPNLGGQEGEPVIGIKNDEKGGRPELGGQEGEPITQSDLVNNISRMDSDTEVIELTHNIENGQIDRRSGSIMSTGHVAEGNTNELQDWSHLPGIPADLVNNVTFECHGTKDHLVVDGEGLYQQNELELASSLGGQEGEPVVAPVSDMVFENLGGQDALIVMLEPDHQAVAPF